MIVVSQLHLLVPSLDDGTTNEEHQPHAASPLDLWTQWLAPVSPLPVCICVSLEASVWQKRWPEPAALQGVPLLPSTPEPLTPLEPLSPSDALSPLQQPLSLPAPLICLHAVIEVATSSRSVGLQQTVPGVSVCSLAVPVNSTVC